ncbi:unnamed protein product, partial [Choristocarpus tenellus]
HPCVKVSWNKPLLLGNEELRPFLSEDQAAFKIQQLLRNLRAREFVRNLMRKQWSRVYSPQEKRFYYFYHGKSPLILPQKARWSQPCKLIGGPWVWRPLVTDDLAALRIQNMWRSAVGMRDIRNIIRQQVYSLQRDPITGGELYCNNRTGENSPKKPSLLGRERWDPQDMLQWGVEETVVFIRRCGLRRYAAKFHHFNVDGALFMTFEPEDFQLLGMTNSLCVKKLLLEIERRDAFVGYNTRTRDLLRRAALRQRYFKETQATVLQRWWREILKARFQKQWQNMVKTTTGIAEREKIKKE